MSEWILITNDASVWNAVSWESLSAPRCIVRVQFVCSEVSVAGGGGGRGDKEKDFITRREGHSAQDVFLGGGKDALIF